MSKEKHNPFASFAGRKNKKIEESFIKHDLQEEHIKLLYIENLVDETNNPYPITELEDLIESIKSHGLEQNLVVKQVDKNLYTIVSGHRRFAAIKHIIENDINKEYGHLEEIYCKIISQNENEIITHLRLHETNFQNRNLLKLKEEDKLKIVEDYLHWLDRARKENVLINGKEIKGKTREILAERFNINKDTAQKLITKIKKGAENQHLPKKEKSINEQVSQIVNQLDKINENVSAIIEQLDDTQIKQIKSSFDAIHEILMFGK